jgi:hypothetical protein
VNETHEIQHAPVPLPDIQELTEAQVCGRACVWCAVVLCNSVAVDLGARDVTAHGLITRWFPRGCRSCAYTRLFDEFKKHLKGCTQCSTSLPWCTQGQRLFGAAMRVGRKAPR